MKSRSRSLCACAAAFVLFCLFRLVSAVAAVEFTGLEDYQNWAANTGYPRNLLIPMGIYGVNQDYFHSIPDSAGYTSGKIVIGDSRCCQLGIWQNRAENDDYASFAVWGGHYIPGTGTSIMTEELLSDVERCFQAQIRAQGQSTVFLFATVNDYDYLYNNNAGHISAAVASAELIASMSYEYQGIVFHPAVIMIGFDGGRSSGDIFGIPQETFNRFIGSYNTQLREAVENSPILRETASLFTTVPEITGGNTTFISDGLHYSDAALQTITDYVKNHP